MSAPATTLLCSVCRSARCQSEACNGPDQRWLTAEQLQAEGVARAKASPRGIGHERTVIESCRSRIKRLPTTEITEEAKLRVIRELDKLFDAYTDERELTAAETQRVPDVFELFDNLKRSLVDAGKVSA